LIAVVADTLLEVLAVDAVERTDRFTKFGRVHNITKAASAKT
jgi:hypothetical protein